MNQSEGTNISFSIGEFPVGRSIFGLRKSQIVGFASVVLFSFVFVIFVSSIGSILLFLSVSIAGGFSFLFGYKNLTLDKVVLALFQFGLSKSNQRKAGYRQDLLGDLVKNEKTGQVIAFKKGSAAHMTASYSSRRRRFGRNFDRDRGKTGGDSRSSSEVGDPESSFHVGRRTRMVVFEVFGKNFIFRDPDQQGVSALAFGTALSSISSSNAEIKSMAFIYVFDESSVFGESLDVSPNSYSELGDENSTINKTNTITRRCFVVARFASSENYKEAISVLKTSLTEGGLEIKALGKDAMNAVIGFGTKSRNLRGLVGARSNWSHILLEDRFMRIFEVVELPKGSVTPDFLASFAYGISFPALISFRLLPIDNRYAMRKLRSKRSGVMADAGIRSLMGFLARNSESKTIDALARQESELDLGYEMFSVSARVATYANELKILDERSRELLVNAERSGLVLDVMYGRQQLGRRELFGLREIGRT